MVFLIINAAVALAFVFNCKLDHLSRMQSMHGFPAGLHLELSQGTLTEGEASVGLTSFLKWLVL
jgi:hypothetical protein